MQTPQSVDQNPYASPSTDTGDTDGLRRPPGRWRAVVGAILILYPGIGLIGAQVGLLGLLGVVPISSEYSSWGEYFFFSILFLTLVMFGIRLFRSYSRRRYVR